MADFEFAGRRNTSWGRYLWNVETYLDFPVAKEWVRAPAAVSDFELGPAEFARVKLGLEPDARQREVLEWTGKRGILNCSRQWGESTMAAAKAVHRAWSRPGSLVLAASPSERQSAEFLRKASSMLRTLKVRVRGDGDNAISLLFPNGSRIVGLPGTEGTVRGFSAVSLLLIDEAARVEDAMYKSLRPMLAVGDGDLWLMSTPHGKNHQALRWGEPRSERSIAGQLRDCLGVRRQQCYCHGPGFGQPEDNHRQCGQANRGGGVSLPRGRHLQSSDLYDRLPLLSYPSEQLTPEPVP